MREKLISNDHEGLIISNPYNILYLSGFKGLSSEEREAWILITKTNMYFFTDGRYESQATKLSSWRELRRPIGSHDEILSLRSRMTICIISHEKKLTDYLQEIIEKENLKTIGYENNNLTVSEYEKFSEKLTAKLFPTLGIVEKFREIKTDEEIKLIQKACDFTDKCLSDIVRIIKPGLTEAEIAFKMEMWIKQRGLDLAFYPIVAVDENSAEAHFDTRTWGKAKVKKDSIVLIDFGIMYKNYRSDMTRMVFVGHPNKEIVRTYEALLAAQEAGIKALFNTNKSSEIDAECRKLLKQLKLPNYTHSTGHGVGLEIHENPRLSPTSSDSLQKGHVFTIEPGIYIPGKYGMRIEDTIVLTDDLSPKVLTKFSKKLLII